MKKLNGYAIAGLLLVVVFFAVPIVGYFYIASQHVGPPTLEQLRAQYPTCEQRSEYVTLKIKERQERPIESIIDSIPKMQFSDKPVTSLGEWWAQYRTGTEKILDRRDRHIFGDTLYELGSGCWHD